MLYHHDSRSYDEAASAAAISARAKLEAVIENGRTKAAQVVQSVMENQPTDRIVAGQALRFTASEAAGITARFGTNGDAVEQRFHRHALQQAAGRVDLPWSYLGGLVEAESPMWARELAAHNLNTLYRERSGASRYLVRSIGDEARGFLSDRFRRLDSRPIFDRFIQAASAIGALPCEGYVSDTRVALKAILPMVFEPVPHEVMAFGAVIENSDFGNGALSIRAFMLRLWCTNFAITDLGIREVHLGGRLAEDIRWSDKTYELDTARTASAVADVVNGHLAPASVDKLLGAIKGAAAQKLDPQAIVATLRKSLTKGEAEEAVGLFNSPEVEMLPPGNTMWRMSNAVSWLAGKTEDTERKLDLMKVAGALLPKGAKEAA